MSPPPVWLMRQAGRYLPEYRATRAKAKSFLDLCYSPPLAEEVTLQPIRRFGFDAAILFSDILVVPDALGRKVEYVDGEGPRLEPINAEEIGRLKSNSALAHLAPVIETVARVRSRLPDETALIGFCGAPWTVATYMIAGEAKPDQMPARMFAYRDEQTFASLIDILTEVSVEYLSAQLQAGADAVMIFDSWAGILPAGEFEKWCLEPAKRIVAGVRKAKPDAKVIGFPRGAGGQYARFAQVTQVNAVGIDWSVDATTGRAVQALAAVQGNLDPLALLAGGEALDRAVDRVLADFGSGPLIFNLGHGILPTTPIENVERMVKRVRGDER